MTCPHHVAQVPPPLFCSVTVWIRQRCLGYSSGRIKTQQLKTVLILRNAGALLPGGAAPCSFVVLLYPRQKMVPVFRALPAMVLGGKNALTLKTPAWEQHLTLLLTFLWPKQVTCPSVTSGDGDLYSPRKGTGYSYHCTALWSLWSPQSCRS